MVYFDRSPDYGPDYTELYLDSDRGMSDYNV